MGVQINGSEGNVIATKGTYSGNVTIGGTLTYEDVTNIDSVGLVTARNGIEIGARPGVAASISVDGNMIVSGITTFTPGGSEIVRINSGGLLVYNDVSFFGASTHAYWDHSASSFALSDNTKLKIGSSGSDLQLYHDGSNSYIIDSGTGDLIINTDSTISLNPNSGGHYGLRVISNGSVELYEANSKKLETDASGVTVTGRVAATSYTGDGSALTGITQTTINNNGTSKIITGSGTANTLNANVHLTFDGSTLDLTGKLRVDINSTSGAGSGGAEGIFLRNTNETDGNAVTIFAGADDYAAAASAINFINIDHSANTGAITFDTRKTGNVYAEKMRISSEGYVTKPLNVSFMVKADSTQAYSGSAIFVCNSPQTSGVCHNIGGHFNTSTGVFTAPVAGRYWLSMDTGPQFLSSNPTDGWQITIQKNGVNSEVASLLFAGGENGNEDHIRADGIFNLAANDEIRWKMSGYGGTMNFVGTKFQGYLLG